ncbi:MAG: DoxX family protein [bacterium]|nr:DoxX family protein [bacterium]
MNMFMGKSCKEWGMFILRVVLGVAFFIHGWDKLQNIDGVIGFFSSIGLPPFFAYLVAWSETLAGLALILGFFTQIAGYVISIIMLVAIFKVKLKGGYLGGYELDLIYLASALAIAWSGAGSISGSAMMCGCSNCMMCGKSMKCKLVGGAKCDKCEGCTDMCSNHEMK